jgi:hypothetical protein
MSDPAEPPADETPLQRALRLKQAAERTRSKPPGAGKGPDRAAGPAAGASKPWMKR